MPDTENTVANEANVEPTTPPETQETSKAPKAPAQERAPGAPVIAGSQEAQEIEAAVAIVVAPQIAQEQLAEVTAQQTAAKTKVDAALAAEEQEKEEAKAQKSKPKDTIQEDLQKASEMEKERAEKSAKDAEATLKAAREREEAEAKAKVLSEEIKAKLDSSLENIKTTQTALTKSQAELDRLYRSEPDRSSPSWNGWKADLTTAEEKHRKLVKAYEKALADAKNILDDIENSPAKEDPNYLSAQRFLQEQGLRYNIDTQIETWEKLARQHHKDVRGAFDKNTPLNEETMNQFKNNIAKLNESAKNLQDIVGRAEDQGVNVSAQRARLPQTLATETPDNLNAFFKHAQDFARRLETAHKDGTDKDPTVQESLRQELTNLGVEQTSVTNQISSTSPLAKLDLLQNFRSSLKPTEEKPAERPQEIVPEPRERQIAESTRTADADSSPHPSPSSTH